jgi:hypothetical protein
MLLELSLLPQGQLDASTSTATGVDVCPSR